MATEATNSAVKARVVSLQVCRQDDGAFRLEDPSMADFHLVATLKDVKLENSAALAISYTWGTFDREFGHIGHLHDGTLIGLTLGKEWSPAEFMRTLASLSSEFGAVWLDQLCIPQKGSEIAATLAKIPLIYKVLDTRVLVPGRLCTCLRRWLKQHGLDGIMVAEQMVPNRELSAIWERTMVYASGSVELSQCLTECSSSLGVCSYFDRIWTRQELHYSNRVQLGWTSNQAECCLPLSEASIAQIYTLGVDRPNAPYLTKWIQKLHHDGVADQVVMERIKLSIMSWCWTGAAAFEQAYDEDADPQPPGLISYYDFLRFLLGFPLTHRNRDISEFQSGVNSRDAAKHDLDLFFTSLRFLRMSHRKATDPKDYVLAVWPECPGYTVPQKFREMDLAALLEDAVLQLEANHGVSLPVHGPSGLFAKDDSVGSGLLRPIACLRSKAIRRVSDVYNLISSSHENLPKPRQGCQGVSFMRNDTPSDTLLSRLAVDFEASLDARDTSNKILLLVDIIAEWPVWLHSDIMQVDPLEQEPGSPTSIMADFRVALLDAVDSRTAPDGVIADAEAEVESLCREKVDHHAEMHRIVTAVFGLDVEVCRQHGLRLMLADEPNKKPVVRISRKRYPSNVGTRAATDETSNVLLGARAPANLTVLASGNTSNYDVWSCFEADLEDAEADPPTYRVSGAWVCTSSPSLSGKLTGKVNAQGNDATLL